PSVIKLAYEGVDSMDVDMRGDLVLKVGGVEIRQHKPNIYQETDAARKEIGGHFVRMENHRIGCQIDPYDIAKDLVIDPVFIYSTYLGGTIPAPNSRGGDRSYGIAIDAQGDAYITGATESVDFPTVNAIQPHNGGYRDALVTKLNPTGSALLYSTSHLSKIAL